MGAYYSIKCQYKSIDCQTLVNSLLWKLWSGQTKPNARLGQTLKSLILGITRMSFTDIFPLEKNLVTYYCQSSPRLYCWRVQHIFILTWNSGQRKVRNGEKEINTCKNVKTGVCRRTQLKVFWRSGESNHRGTSAQKKQKSSSFPHFLQFFCLFQSLSN